MSLGLERTLGESITSRYELGPFGRGWVTPWTTSLVKDQDGSVTIVSAGGAQRRFQPDSRYPGTYFADAGDYSHLTPVAGGTFILRDVDGAVAGFRADGKLDYIQDTNGNRITAGYAADRLITLTHSAGQSLTLAYNGTGRVVSITSSDGHQATYSYDATSEHLLAVQGYDGLTTHYTYRTSSEAAVEHALASVQFPDGTHQFFGYDQQGRLVNLSRDGNADRLTFTYDTAGRVSVTDSASATNQIYFDQYGLAAKLVDPNGKASYAAYDNNFNLTRVTDPTGAFQSFNYDAQGNLSQFVDSAGQVTTLQYGGPFQRLLSLTDANGTITSYSYDPYGNPTATIYPNNLAERVNYDAAGNAVSTTNRRVQPITYTYDNAGRVTRQTFADNTHSDFTYDSQGNLHTASNTAGTTTFDYDVGDRLTKVTYPNGRFLSYQYDAAGRRIQMIDQGSFTVNYTYDALGRLASLTNGTGGLIVSYTYNLQGRLSRKNQGNGTYATYEYDAGGQLLHLVNHAPNDLVNSRFDYTYDNLGRRSSMGTSDGTWSYAYDVVGQLIHAVFVSTNPQVPNQNLSYEYDALGNRVRTIENGVETTYSRNNLNEYTSVGSAVLAYDADGNLISEAGGGRNATYTYDAQNKLVKVVTSEGTWTYEYDIFGNRIATVHNGQRTEFLLDPTGLVDVVGEYDGVGNIIAHYAQGLGLAGRFDSSGNPTYYDFDAIGSTAGLTNSTGNYVNRYLYTPFGENISSTEAVTNSFEFVGQFGVANDDNGLEFMRARYYSLDLDRFASIDPLGIAGSGTNLFAYAGNRPTDFIDPAGLSFKDFENAGKIALQYTKESIGATSTYMSEFASSFNRLIGAARGPAETYVSLLDKGVFTRQDVKNGIDTIKYGATHPGAGFTGRVQYQAILGAEAEIPDSSPGAGNQDNGFGNKTPTPNGGQSGGTAQSFIPVSRDPNEMTGPVGFGPSGFVQPDIVFPYRIDFENDATATAPAQRVDVTNQLNANLDWNTLELTELAFGDVLVNVPPHSQYFQTAVPVHFNGQSFEVQIEIGLDPGTGQVYAHFQSVDPQTSLPPDVLVGFLPPENGTGRGQGHFSYTIQPRANLTTGTVIKNIAVIQFDHGEIIATNQIAPHDPAQGTDPTKEARNTIDAGAPSSQVTTLLATVSATSIPVSWSGQDDVGGSGMAGYDVYVSVDGGAFTAWQTATLVTSATYAGEVGHTYRFFSVAYDNVGQVEAVPESADATTTIATNSAPSVVSNQSFDVPERSPNGTVVGTVQASDSDASSVLTFSLIGGNTGNAFTIDAATGQIQVASGAVLNDELTAAYFLIIQVADNGVPSLSNSDQITIHVTNVNVAPSDLSLSANNITENNSANATVGTLSATDPDAGSRFTFSLASGVGSNDNGSFSIVGNVLQITSASDFEIKSRYAVRVQVADQNGLTFEKPFTISITNVNEAPVISSIAAQPIPEDTATGNLSFTIGDPETPAGNLILSAASSNPELIPDANIVFSGTGANRSLVVTPAANQSGTATITVTVSDGTLSSDQTFQVTVQAVDDAPAINLNSQPLVYHVAAKQIVAIDGAATIADVDTPTLDFSGAELRVSGQSVKDAPSILKLNGISRKGKNVLFGTTIIGTVAGGKKSAPLTVNLNGAATQSSVQSLLRSIGFKSADKIAGNRTIKIQITNIAGTNTNQAARQVQVGP